MRFFKFKLFKNQRKVNTPRKERRTTLIHITKRQKFIITVLILSFAFFFSERIFGQSGIVFSIALTLLTELFFLWALLRDIDETKSYQVFVLPFFYSLSFGLFYFLTPHRFITNIVVALLFAVGMYSLLLSQNIFIVASVRTIALLTGARIVSFVLTLISFFFLINVVFSLHFSAIPTSMITFLITIFLLYHTLWTYTLEKSLTSQLIWVSVLSLGIFEISLLLWFWPSTPTVIALFLTGLFYIVAGLSHVWLDRRLFRNVLWEYVWVGLVIFIIFIFSTQWRA